MTSFGQSSDDLDLLCGIQVSAKTIEHISAHHPLATTVSEAEVNQISLDGGMVRVLTPKGQPNEWKQYKAVRINGDGLGNAWFQDNPALLLWTHRLVWATLVDCLGDGHLVPVWANGGIA